jgi:hypothetical protein
MEGEDHTRPLGGGVEGGGFSPTFSAPASAPDASRARGGLTCSTIWFWSGMGRSVSPITAPRGPPSRRHRTAPPWSTGSGRNAGSLARGRTDRGGALALALPPNRMPGATTSQLEDANTFPPFLPEPRGRARPMMKECSFRLSGSVLSGKLGQGLGLFVIVVSSR